MTRPYTGFVCDSRVLRGHVRLEERQGLFPCVGGCLGVVALAGVVEEAVRRAVVDVLLDGLAAGVQLALKLVRPLSLIAAIDG